MPKVVLRKISPAKDQSSNNDAANVDSRKHPFEIALRKFKRDCEKAGIYQETRRRESFEKPTWERKRKNAAARKRWQKKLAKEDEALQRKRLAKRRFNTLNEIVDQVKTTTASAVKLQQIANITTASNDSNTEA